MTMTQDHYDVQELLEADKPLLRPGHVRLIVANRCGVLPEDIHSRFKDHPTLWARRVYVLLLRGLCGMSFPAMAKEMGQYSHSTSCHMMLKMEKDGLPKQYEEIVRDCVSALGTKFRFLHPDNSGRQLINKIVGVDLG